MPSTGGGIRWEGFDELKSNISGMDGRARRALLAAAEWSAPQIEAWMKSNAIWIDRTGNARNGLIARAEATNKGVRIVLAYSVPYGIWLEVRFSGRYGIIGPAMQEWAPKVIQSIEGLLRAEMAR